MFATTKVLHVTHLIVAKVLTAKGLIAASMVAGTVSAGYVVESGMLTQYPPGTILLVSNPAFVEWPAVDGSSSKAEAEAAMTASIDPSIPHLTITAKRLTLRQRIEEDIGIGQDTQTAAK